MPSVSTAEIKSPSPPPVLKGLTYEQFLDLGEEYKHYEYVDGKAVPKAGYFEDGLTQIINGKEVPMAAVHEPHARVTSWLFGILVPYVDAKDLGQVFGGEYQLRMRGVQRGRQPDLMFIKRDHLDRIGHKYLDGPADLVIEVISPGSETTDRGEKFYEYEQAGVSEYWLPDPGRHRCEFYQLDNRGLYRPVTPDENGIYHSPTIDEFWLKPDWLWQDPPPKVLDILRQLGVL